MRSHRAFALRLLVAGAAVAAAALPTRASAASVSLCPWWFSSNESFFTGADLGNTSAPGEISNCRRITLEDDGLPDGTVGYQVIYRSQLRDGTSVPVSGTVLVPPVGGAAAHGIISMASGTVGLHDSCAPSKGLVDGSTLVSSAVPQYLEDGYAVVVTDYQGLRTPGAHQYLNGAPEGKAVIDLARAAMRVPGAGLGPVAGPTSKKVLYTGFSQGGHAALWAAQLTPSYAQGLNVVGALAGGAPVSVEATRAFVSGKLASGGFSYILAGFQGAYPNLDLPSRLSAFGQSFYAAHRDECSFDMVLSSGSQFRSWSSLWQTGKDPITSADPNAEAFRDALAENAVPTTTPTIPLYLFHGDADGVVPYAPHKALADTWAANGADVYFRTIWWGTHSLSGSIGRDGSRDWVDARFGVVRG